MPFYNNRDSFYGSLWSSIKLISVQMPLTSLKSHAFEEIMIRGKFVVNHGGKCCFLNVPPFFIQIKCQTSPQVETEFDEPIWHSLRVNILI